MKTTIFKSIWFRNGLCSAHRTNAEFHDGVFHDGVFHDGVFHDGVFHDGVLKEKSRLSIPVSNCLKLN